jgi:hypothetical protein
LRSSRLSAACRILIKINEGEQELRYIYKMLSQETSHGSPMDKARKKRCQKKRLPQATRQSEGCDIADYEKCRQRSFPEGCYWRDRTPLDLAVRLGMVQRQPDQEPGVNVDPEMVRFLRDGACKR